MKSLVGLNGRHLAWLGLSAALLALVLACGPGEKPTSVPTPVPTATTAILATPTRVATPTPVPTPTPTPIGGVPKRGGTIVFTTSYPTHWDASQQCCPGGGLSVDGKLYLTMMYEEGRDKYVCDLCTRWSIEDAGKTMVFQLRDDIKFHNGTPITAQDMKYSLEKEMGLPSAGGVANQRMGYIKEYVESLETPDARTFKIHLKRPAPIVPGTLADTFAVIYPAGTKRADLTTPPLGPNNKYTSGPFYVKEAVQDSHIVFERNPNYFKPGLPYLDGMRGQVFTDLAAQMTALLIGKADLYQTLDAGSPQFWPQLEKAVADGKMGSLSQPLWCSIGNMWFNFDNTVMKSKKVRQAISLSQDRDEFGKVRYGGRYLATTFYPADTFWGRSSDQIWNVIPGFGQGAKKVAEREQAKKLLAEAGFPAGIPDMELLTGYTEGSVEAMQRGLLSVGINAHIQYTADAEQRWGRGEFVLLDRRLCLALGDPDEAMANYFIPGGPRNLGHYENPEITRLFQLLTVEIDQAKRKQINTQMVDILLDDVAAVNLTDGSQTYWFSGKLRGVYNGITMYGIGAHRGETWWLDK